MYAILIIILVITLIEIYNIIPERQNETISDKLDTTEEINLKLNEYRVKEGTNVFHSPGRILIKQSYNLILKYNDENILMEKDKNYNIKDNFEIEIINIDNNDIVYYYISS
jgi:hypothetical protein|tara:strand:- start:2273 stop:2605 length:333 start_codon:yes stop_codon:yes gene_type:complete